MRNKIIISILILVAILFAIEIVDAAPAAPSPTCEITASILKVEKTRIQIPDVLPEDRWDYYRVNLDILDIKMYKQEGALSCDSSYIELAEKSGQILILEEYNKNPISEGQKIKAKIHFGGDEWFGGYFLSDVQVLEGITTEKDKTTKELNYWYYIIPSIIILLVILYILFRRKKK